MSNHIERINLSNATHNGGTVPDGWQPFRNYDGSLEVKHFGPITTQAYKNTITNEVVLTIKGTDGDIADWTVVNASFATGNYPKEIKDLVTYANGLNETYNTNLKGETLNNISVTGFSQGGGLAELLSYTFGWGGNGQNSPGAGNIIQNEAYKTHIEQLGTEPKGVPNDFVTIIEDGDIVDNFGGRLSDVFELNLTSDSSLLYAIGGILVPEPLAKIYAIYKIVSERIGQHDIQKVTDYVNNLSDDEKASLLISLKKTTFDDNLAIYGDPSNPQKITFTDEKGDYQVWERDKNGEFVRINSIDYSVVTNTAINQIGSLIISNNPDFSNIEKIAVSTSVATIADFVTYKGTEEFNSSQEGVDNLKGAVVSFAVSSYFAKNDNISDLLGMDGTFLGDLADFTVSFTTSYSIGVLANNGFSFDALSNAFSSTTNSATGAITPSSYSTALTCRLINIF